MGGGRAGADTDADDGRNAAVATTTAVDANVDAQADVQRNRLATLKGRTTTTALGSVSRARGVALILGDGRGLALVDDVSAIALSVENTDKSLSTARSDTAVKSEIGLRIDKNERGEAGV